MTIRQDIIKDLAYNIADDKRVLSWHMLVEKNIAEYKSLRDLPKSYRKYFSQQTDRAKARMHKEASNAAAALIEKWEKSARIPDAMAWVEVDTTYAAQSLAAEMNFAAEAEALVIDAAQSLEAVETSAAFMVAANAAETHDELPVYAAYTLIASYWYREAYKGLPPHVSQVTGRRAMCLKFAQWYDQLAGKHYGDGRHAGKYHSIYRVWADNGFTFQMLRMLCHFQGVEV